MSIASNLAEIKDSIAKTARSCGRDPQDIKLVAVSKRHSIAAMQEAMEAGHFLFGENYIQEAVLKRAELSREAKIHFIGHVQSNKAKQASEHFSMVETVDRYKLARSLNKHLERLDRTLNILLQVNIGNDPGKSGVAPEKTEELLRDIAGLSRIRTLGLMTIPPKSQEHDGARIHFRNLRLLGEELAARELFFDNNAVELSMGMTQDFTTAIEEGATIVRVGTAIFGMRPPLP